MAFGGETAESYYDEGLTASMKGDVTRAIEHFERALQLDNTLTAARHQLGKCYARQGETQRAIELFQRVIKEKPGLVPVRVDLGYALLECGRPGDAERVFLEITHVKPDNSRAQLGLAFCAFNTGRWEEAMHLAQAAVVQGGASFAAFFLLGRAASLCDRSDIAVESLKRAEAMIEKSIETSPDQPEGYYLRGEVQFAQGNFAAALDSFRAAEDRSQPHQHYVSYGERFNRVDILARRGVCLQRLDRLADAREVGRQILGLDPEHKLGRALSET
ncbi:MAG: tetratricopeptide repeat protein [Candidatus Hydrogenedentes bacterium]|nr:tetratricopeptide repeat protein [Candidatus Hydrogenedentota bacterium]